MEVKRHENRTRNAVAGMQSRSRSIQALRRRPATDSFRPTFHTCAPRTCIQKEGNGEPESTRTQTQGQALGLGPRFPRHGLVDRFRFSQLADEFRISKSLTDDLTYANIKTLGIGHLAIVKPKSLFVDIAE
jgi:hypothetical protein